ncbi:MAG: hypothetical protein PHW15_03005 [Patescibacteria group bacterium]|nr:hypothetical protein [Patescibacteria group bacterium]
MEKNKPEKVEGGAPFQSKNEGVETGKAEKILDLKEMSFLELQNKKNQLETTLSLLIRESPMEENEQKIKEMEMALKKTEKALEEKKENLPEEEAEKAEKQIDQKTQELKVNAEQAPTLVKKEAQEVAEQGQAVAGEAKKKIGFWKRAKNFFSSREVQKAGGKMAYDTGTTLIGVKTITDLLGLAFKRGDIYNYLQQNKIVKSEKEKLNEMVEKIVDLLRERESKTEETADKEGLVTRNEFLRKTVAEFRQKVEEAKSISPEEKKEFKALLAKIISERKKKVETVEKETEGKTKKTLDLYLHTKISALKIVKDALNTALSGAQMHALRAPMYMTMSALERAEKANLTFEKLKIKGEVLTPEQEEERSKFAHLAKDLTIVATTEFVRSIAFQAKTEERKKMGWKVRSMDFIAAFGQLVRMVGLAGISIGDLIPKEGGGSIFDGNIFDRVKESSEKSIDKLIDAYQSGGAFGVAKQVGENYIENATNLIPQRIKGIFKGKGTDNNLTQQIEQKGGQTPKDYQTEQSMPQTEPISPEPVVPIEENLDYQGGKNVWRELENQLERRNSFKEIFGQGDEAEKTYAIDYLKDRIAANPQEYGLPEGTDVDDLTDAQLKNVDWDKLCDLGSEEIDKAFPNLTEEMKENIIDNNKLLQEYVSKTGKSLDTDTVDQVLNDIKEAGGVDEYVMGQEASVPPISQPLDTNLNINPEVPVLTAEIGENINQLNDLMENAGDKKEINKIVESLVEEYNREPILNDNPEFHESLNKGLNYQLENLLENRGGLFKGRVGQEIENIVQNITQVNGFSPEEADAFTRYLGGNDGVIKLDDMARFMPNGRFDSTRLQWAMQDFKQIIHSGKVPVSPEFTPRWVNLIDETGKRSSKLVNMRMINNNVELDLNNDGISDDVYNPKAAENIMKSFNEQEKIMREAAAESAKAQIASPSAENPPIVDNKAAPPPPLGKMPTLGGEGGISHLDEKEQLLQEKERLIKELKEELAKPSGAQLQTETIPPTSQPPENLPVVESALTDTSLINVIKQKFGEGNIESKSFGNESYLKHINPEGKVTYLHPDGNKMTFDESASIKLAEGGLTREQAADFIQRREVAKQQVAKDLSNDMDDMIQQAKGKK